MKLVLYIRGAKGGKVDMRTSVEAEPCYDNPRVANLASEVRAILDEAIRTGEEAGALLHSYSSDYSVRVDVEALRFPKKEGVR